MSQGPDAGRRRIFLSVPHLGGSEERYVREAIATNWMSTVGPNIDAFEAEFSRRVGLPAVAVSSGTAALHLGLRLLGVGPGDEVLSPTLTFVASVNPITYLGGTPVFLDSEPSSWNLDPNRLEDALRQRGRRGRRPKAVVVVHLFGQCADLDPIMSLCERHGVAVLEDAAEALGALYRDKPAGTIAPVGAYSSTGTRSSPPPGGACWSPTIRPGCARPGSGRRRPVIRGWPTSTPRWATTIG
jgi:pyridoxal phosphate-dependent aminotransferase EpsN